MSDRYDKLTEKLEKKGGLVSSILSTHPAEEEVEVKKERAKEKKKERIPKVKKNFYVAKDVNTLLKAMSLIEDRNPNEIVEEAIVERFARVFREYDEVDREIIRRKFFSELSKTVREKLETDLH